LSLRRQVGDLGRQEDTPREEGQQNDLLDAPRLRSPDADNERDGRDREEQKGQRSREAHQVDHPCKVSHAPLSRKVGASAQLT
jgi:hypothetical protein